MAVGAQASGLQVGIDVGGTFTDAVLAGADGRARIAKVRTRPEDIAAGFADTLAELCADAGVEPARVTYLVHGTTIATNAVVQRRFARTALITTAGFRDILEIGTQQRPRVYDLWAPHPRPIVDRADAIEVGGRIGAGGEELEPLAEDDVRAAARALRERGVAAVAVALMFSFANPAHERRIAEILSEEPPGLPVSLSSDVAPEFREYLRASTTALNAALLPLVGGYVRALAERAAAVGVSVPVHLMQSNGGVTTAESAAELPVALAASGPAAAVIGSARLAELVGEPDVLTFDMGGTTADVALVRGGLPQLRFTGEQGGHPVNIPQIDVLSIGAGGGSIARVDRFGSLTVGPESAGAVPGPAAYGLGGEDATVTDAHVVIGTLDASRRLGSGAAELDAERAFAAVRDRVADPLGLGVEEAATAVLRIANANMARALRLVSVARGHDPRRTALVAIGGAGPMHGCDIADELGIPRVVVPRHPGVAAALGLLLSDLRHDVRLSWIRPTAEVDPAELGARFAELESRARELLARAAHGTDADVAYDVDMRYRGQAYNLTVPAAPGPVTAETLTALEDAFHAAHRAAYDYTPSVTETEIVTLRVRAAAAAPAIDWQADEPVAAGAEDRERPVWTGGGHVAYRVLDRRALAPGATVAGPLVIEQDDATTVLHAGWSGAVRAAGTLVLARDEVPS
jgi:N-methylhydantoinase A